MGQRITRRRDTRSYGCWRTWLVNTAGLLALGAGVHCAAEPAPPEKAQDPLAVQMQHRIDSAVVVARVEITGIHRLVDHALSEPGMVAIQGYRYSVAAHKVWKGAPVEQFVFRLSLADCREKLQLGQQYLIFARANPLGYLELASCEAAVAQSEAGSLLVQLDQYDQG